MNYSDLLVFGDIIPLNMECNVGKLKDEIKDFEWQKYNPRTPIERYGLSVTSLDGELGGIDLDSFYQYNKEHGTSYKESSFKTFTDVYYKSEEVQKLVDPWYEHLERTHFINLKKGGYFPPHRDQISLEQKNFRILVPINSMNPPLHYFMYEHKPVHFELGRGYFINTNKVHSLFSFADKATMLVMNINCNEESMRLLCRNFQQK